jgi:hypothetical protein
MMSKNKGAPSVGLMWWMLHRCGTISHYHPWELMPDLYYRDPEEIEEEVPSTAAKAGISG